MTQTAYDLRLKAKQLYTERQQYAATIYNWYTSPTRKNLLSQVRRLAKQLDPRSDDEDMKMAIMFVDSIMLREDVHYPMIGETS